MIRRWSVACLALGLIITGCGGGEGDDAEALADAIADAMAENMDDDSFDREQADCFGAEVVDRMGVDRLAAVGLSLEDVQNGAEPGSVDLTDDDVAEMTEAVTECIDFGSLLVAEMTAGITISDESAQCLIDGVNEADFLRTFAEATFLDEEVPAEANAAMTRTLFDLLGDCLTEEELSNLGG